MKMKKNIVRLLTLFLTVLLLLPTLCMGASAAHLMAYWPLQKAYLAALDSGDEDAILKACEDIMELYKALDTVEANGAVNPVALKAAPIYEKRGMYADALRCYKLYKACCEYAQEHTSDDYTERIRFSNAFIEQYSYLDPVVYAASAESDAIPYYGAKGEPKAGTYVGMSGSESYKAGRDSAYLLYVQFFHERARDFAWQLPEYDTNYVLELAWNVPNSNMEDLEKINSGNYDSYIIDNLKYLASVNCKTVLLRFGAEVNVWGCNSTYAKNGQLENFKQSFKDAFRRIAKLRDTYAPNVAMVYSPNDISNLYVTPLDFYPGDDFVDWVGMSSYVNPSTQAKNTFGSMEDALYKRGKYANQIVKIKEIVDAFGDRKPIMVSECGFSYVNEGKAVDPAFSSEKLDYFYSYVNMVFPQVKAVFYFNTNYGKNQYKLFESTGSSVSAAGKLPSVYLEAVKGNVAMSSTLAGKPKSYVPVETLDEVTDTLDLSLFAYYPGGEPITVTYTFDGKKITETTDAPYALSLGKSYLTQGRHTLSVKSVCGKTAYTKNYVVYVSHSGRVHITEPDLTDIKQYWGYNYIAYCVAEGFFDGFCDSKFYPTSVVTRSMFVMMLGRAAGIDPDDYKAPDIFTDVAKDAEYAPYVTWALESGLTKGTTDTTFSPDGELTREQACVFLVRYCNHAGIKLGSADGAKPFADDAKIPSWAKEGVYIARDASIVSGKDGNMFDPKGELTREQIAVILKNFHEKFVIAK